jgi:uncharacterized protein
MKLQPDKFDVPSISAAGPGWVMINGEKITHNLIVGSRGELERWDCPGFELLSTAHFDPLAALAPELVIFGSGSRLRFPHPSLSASLLSRRIGLETMDTAAACRTYNILAGEGRHVIAALLVASPL